MVLWSHFVDYFFTGSELTVSGKTLAASLTDVVGGIAEFSTLIFVVLGNHV